MHDSVTTKAAAVIGKPLPEGVELDLVFATIEFANAELLSVRQVEDIFRRLPLQRRVWQTLEGAPDALEAFKRDQAELRRWLYSIATRGSVRPADERTIAQRLRDTIKVAAVLDLEDGKLVERREYLLEGVQACYSMGTALILEYADRLGKCPFPKCQQFFFDTGTRGARQLYCSRKHADADRQRIFRQGGK